MKKRVVVLTLLLFLLASLSAAGCNRQSADQYAGEKITSMKEEEPEAFASLLDSGIAQSNASYTLQFPEELKEPYLKFLQSAFKAINFEVAEAKKQSDGVYSVSISFTPLDLAATTQSAVERRLNSLSSSDLTAEADGLLEDSSALLSDAPQYLEKITVSLEVEKTDDGYAISDEELQSFLTEALPNPMSPYDSICEILYTQDFLKSYLDASFKGEVAQFALHKGCSEEEAQEWYESDVFDPPSDLSDSYKKRYSAALKEIMKQCKYTVGVPKKEEGLYNYTVDITVTPNESLQKSFERIENGTYYSIEAVSKDLVETMEGYADSPAYGKETTISLPLNMTELLAAGQEGSAFSELALAILPMPQ